MNAIMSCSELSIMFPQTIGEYTQAAINYLDKHTFKVICGCVSSLDGYWASIEAPSSKEVANIQSFFSGHYQRFGLICLVCTDAHCPCNFFSVAAPGNAGDLQTYLLFPVKVGGHSSNLFCSCCRRSICAPRKTNYSFFWYAMRKSSYGFIQLHCPAEESQGSNGLIQDSWPFLWNPQFL